MQQVKTEDGLQLSRTRRTLPMALLKARELVMEEFRPLLRSYGVTEQQWRVLRVLREAGSIDASHLANILSPSLSRILKTMANEGYIDVQKDKSDGRRLLIRLTQKGRDVLREVAPSSANVYSCLEARLGRDRIERLLNDLDWVIEVLSQPPEEVLKSQ